MLSILFIEYKGEILCLVTPHFSKIEKSSIEESKGEKVHEVIEVSSPAHPLPRNILESEQREIESKASNRDRQTSSKRVSTTVQHAASIPLKRSRRRETIIRLGGWRTSFESPSEFFNDANNPPGLPGTSTALFFSAWKRPARACHEIN